MVRGPPLVFLSLALRVLRADLRGKSWRFWKEEKGKWLGEPRQPEP